MLIYQVGTLRKPCYCETNKKPKTIKRSSTSDPIEWNHIYTLCGEKTVEKIAGFFKHDCRTYAIDGLRYIY